MSPQIAWLGQCEVTLVAFIKLSPSVRYQMPPQVACLREYIATTTASLVFLHCAFSNVSSYCLPEMMQSHTACMYLCIFKCALKSALKGALWHWVHLFPSWKSFIWILEFGRRFFCVTCQIRRNYHVLEAWSSLKEGQKGCLIKTISDVNERPPEELHLIEIWSPEIHTI